jgi:hypothetical protein
MQKNKNFKNKILLGVVALATLVNIGSIAGLNLDAQKADAATPAPRVWVGTVRDYREMWTYNGVTREDVTHWKTLNCRNGYEELSPTYTYKKESVSVQRFKWVYNYYVY